jgi:hypothetical protein
MLYESPGVFTGVWTQQDEVLAALFQMGLELERLDFHIYKLKNFVTIKHLIRHVSLEMLFEIVAGKQAFQLVSLH